MKPGTGALQSQAKSTFTAMTASRYHSMAARLAKKKLTIPFTLSEFRTSTYIAIGGYDSPITCPYCKGIFNLADTAFDHAVPLVRGGVPDLCNIEILCKACNARKGPMNPHEYRLLLEFLEHVIPLARTDVLSRLQKAVPLAAGMRYHQQQKKKQMIQ